MEIFAERIKDYVKKINVSRLANATGIERTFLTKILKGYRNPACEEDVLKIAKALMLTPVQKWDLVEAYYMDKVGEENYRRRKCVKEMIEEAGNLESIYIPFGQQEKDARKLQEDIRIVTGVNQVKQLTEEIIGLEQSEETPYIRMNLLPEEREMIGRIAGLCQREEGTLTHILCMEQNRMEGSIYNLQVFQKILVLFFAKGNYHPLCYYGSLPDEMSTMPYFLLTSNFVILYSYDMEKAILIQEKKMYRFYEELFEKYEENAFPLMKEVEDTKDAVLYNDKNEEKTAGKQFSYQKAPNLTYFYDEKLLGQAVKENYPASDYVLKNLHQKRTERWKKSLTVLYSCFYEDGLSHLLQIGEAEKETAAAAEAAAAEIKKGALWKEYKMALIDNMLHYMKEGKYEPVILRPERLTPSENLSIIINSQGVCCVWLCIPGRGEKLFEINDLSISYALTDFVESLSVSGYAYSKEESREILEQIIEEYI